MYTEIGFTAGVDTLGPTNLNYMEDGIKAASMRYGGRLTTSTFAYTPSDGGTHTVVFSGSSYFGDATQANFEYNSSGVKGFLIPAGVTVADVSFNAIYNTSFSGATRIRIVRYRGDNTTIVADQSSYGADTSKGLSCSGKIDVQEDDYIICLLYCNTTTDADLIDGTSFSCIAF